jgi:eukaryotic-like serine/threonine-protein kinase
MIERLKDIRIWIGLLIVAAAGVASVLLIDRVIMPAYTNYNQGLTVPDVTRLSIDDARLLLENQGLRHEVIDYRANEAYPADYVIDQSPAASMIVKPNRKIYLTVNSSVTPMVRVPDVTNLSLRNATIQLQNHGLQPGNITYVSSRFKNSVMSQSLTPGRQVIKGATVDLTVSDGLGMRQVEIPDIVGLRLSDAQRKLREVGLRVGSIQFRGSAEIEPNYVLGYSPDESPTVFEGETIDLIISELPAAREEREAGAVIIDSTEIARPPQPEFERDSEPGPYSRQDTGLDPRQDSGLDPRQDSGLESRQDSGLDPRQDIDPRTEFGTALNNGTLPQNRF